jgi:hypothetical protein
LKEEQGRRAAVRDADVKRGARLQFFFPRVSRAVWTRVDTERRGIGASDAALPFDKACAAYFRVKA